MYDLKIIHTLNTFERLQFYDSIMPSNEVEQLRRQHQQDTMNKIREIPEFHDFKKKVRIIFMHLGLQYKFNTKEFLDSRDWSDKARIEEYYREIEEFLKNMIK